MDDGQFRDAQADMMRLTLEIVAKTLFDAEIGGETAEASAAMETLIHAFIARTGSLLTPPHWIPTPLNLRVERAIRRLERILDGHHRPAASERQGLWRFAVDASPGPG